MYDFIRSKLESHIEAARLSLTDEIILGIENAAAAIVDAYRAGCKLLIFGNGGSYSQAEHIAGELEGRFYIDRRPLPALTPSNMATMTAVGNDYGYDDVFSRFVDANARKDDVVICLTTSDISEERGGHSTNIYKAIMIARERGCKTIGLLSSKSHKIGEMVDISIKIPYKDTPRIQEMHITCGHIICEIVEKELFGTAE